MQPPEQPPQQQPGGTPSQPLYPQQEASSQPYLQSAPTQRAYSQPGDPSQSLYPQGASSQPLPPPPPPSYPSQPYPSQPFPPSYPTQPYPSQPFPPSYPSQPYPSQPFPAQGQWSGGMPPQMPPQPPKRRSNLTWIVGGALAVILVVAIAGIAIAANGNKSGPNTTASNPTTAPTSTATFAPTDTPTQNASATHHKVGDTISTATWQVTINSASAYAGDPNEFETPQPGDTFLVVEGTFKNLTNQSQTLSTLLFFELQDAQGNKYEDALLISVNGPDGTVLPNGPAHGKWGYEVPLSVHSFVLVFTDDFGQTAYVWDMSI